MAAFNIKEKLLCYLLILATIYTEIEKPLVFTHTGCRTAKELENRPVAKLPENNLQASACYYSSVVYTWAIMKNKQNQETRKIIICASVQVFHNLHWGQWKANK